MSEFTTVEETLFVPMLGRIYCSKHFPALLHDEKALELESRLPAEIKANDRQNQYTLLASAVRSTNMDRYVRNFMEKNPDGIIIQLGCGLETTYYRNDDGKHPWIELDLPEVIRFRKNILGETERDRVYAADGFSEEWVQHVREIYPTQRLLIISSGVFYYFPEDIVLDFMKMLKRYGEIDLVFDTVNSAGMKQMPKYMKQVGHEKATMFFYVDDGLRLASLVGARLRKEEPFYKYTDQKGMKLMTRLSMTFSDIFKMVKMVHLRFNY